MCFYSIKLHVLLVTYQTIWQSKMDNPEKLTPKGTQGDEKQSINTTHYVLDTTIRKQTQLT
jgi:hypothetical protein